MLTSVSVETTRRAEEIFCIPHDAFTVVPNGMVKSPLPQERQILHRGALLVGHVGQMHEGKGWRLLLEAVDRLQRDGMDVQLVLAGKGMDADLASTEALRRPGYVRYLGVVPDAGRSLIPSLDVLVLASWSEGMPMSLVESFAAGVPVVATSVGGIPEVIENDVNGLLIERNVESIVSALQRFLDDPTLSIRLGAGAVRSFDAKFDIKRVVEEYNHVYDAALGASHIKLS